MRQFDRKLVDTHGKDYFAMILFSWDLQCVNQIQTSLKVAAEEEASLFLVP